MAAKLQWRCQMRTSYPETYRIVDAVVRIQLYYVQDDDFSCDCEIYHMDSQERLH